MNYLVRSTQQQGRALDLIITTDDNPAQCAVELHVQHPTTSDQFVPASSCH